MGPLVEAALVGGAANLVGNVTNQMFSRRNARINYEYAEKSAENQYKRQVDFWNMQNAYNDPAAARARMENAGMNPTTDMGSGINSAGSGSTVPGNEYAQSGMMPVVPTNWSGFAQEVANIYNTAMNGNRAVKEAAKIEMEAKLLSLKGSGQELDNDLKRFKNQIEYMFAEDNALYDHWIKQNEHEKSLYDVQNAGKTGKLIDAQTSNTNAGTQRMNTLTPVEKSEIERRTDLVQKQLDFYDRHERAVIDNLVAASEGVRAAARKAGLESDVLMRDVPREELIAWCRDKLGLDPDLLSAAYAADFLKTAQAVFEGKLEPVSALNRLRDIYAEGTRVAKDADIRSGHIPFSLTAFGVGFSH